MHFAFVQLDALNRLSFVSDWLCEDCARFASPLDKPFIRSDVCSESRGFEASASLLVF